LATKLPRIPPVKLNIILYKGLN